MTVAAEDERYPGTAVAAAALATLFFPVVSLIAALVLLSRERVEARRAQLRFWAWAAGGWVALQVVVVSVFFAVAVSGGGSAPSKSGPCIGGPKQDATATLDENGNAVFPCEFGGTVTVESP
ncbi:MAG: hypothetical protein M3M94_00610 [Actinomycetota bacterium]|nr:hypothetical protein [Actinomycetota bacterium]